MFFARERESKREKFYYIFQATSTITHDQRSPIDSKSKAIKKDVFNRIRRSEEELQKAAEMVRGGMTFQTASDTFNIPISTIRYENFFCFCF